MRQNDSREEPASVCPYCNNVLSQRPQRKKKCPFCGNFIYVRTLPSTRERVLVTQHEAEKIDMEWQELSFKQSWLGKLETYGITEKDFDIAKDHLSKKFGREATPRDIVWSLLNELILKNANNLHNLQMLYHEMAWFIYAEGKDSFVYLQQSHKMELLRYRQEGYIRKVEISACDDSCPACQRLNGKVFTIAEALEKMPIPCRECTTDFYGQGKNICRCSYLPFLENDNYNI